MSVEGTSEGGRERVSAVERQKPQELSYWSNLKRSTWGGNFFFDLFTVFKVDFFKGFKGVEYLRIDGVFGVKKLLGTRWFQEIGSLSKIWRKIYKSKSVNFWCSKNSIPFPSNPLLTPPISTFSFNYNPPVKKIPFRTRQFSHIVHEQKKKNV